MDFTDNTLTIVSTDHGARLDFPDIHEEEQKYGMRLRDISMNTFCSFIGLYLPKQVITRMVRSIDIVPTILEIAGLEPILGQGVSLLPLIREREFPEFYKVIDKIIDVGKKRLTGDSK